MANTHIYQQFFVFRLLFTARYKFVFSSVCDITIILTRKAGYTSINKHVTYVNYERSQRRRAMPYWLHGNNKNIL